MRPWSERLFYFAVQPSNISQYGKECKTLADKGHRATQAGSWPSNTAAELHSYPATCLLRPIQQSCRKLNKIAATGPLE